MTRAMFGSCTKKPHKPMTNQKAPTRAKTAAKAGLSVLVEATPKIRQPKTAIYMIKKRNPLTVSPL